MLGPAGRDSRKHEEPTDGTVHARGAQQENHALPDALPRSSQQIAGVPLSRLTQLYLKCSLVNSVCHHDVRGYGGFYPVFSQVFFWVLSPGSPLSTRLANITAT